MATRVKRTHLVRHNILHDGKMYKKGETITFGPESEADHIRELIRMGYLDGKEANQLDRDRERLEEDLGIHLMTDDEVEVLWKRFLSLTPEQRRELAQRDARQKTDADAARLANIDETAQRDHAVDDEGQGEGGEEA